MPGDSRAQWLQVALIRACLGERVVYVCEGRDSTREAFALAEQLARQEPFGQRVSRIYRAYGEQHIRFNTGGAVMFQNPCRHNYRGVSADVLILEPGAETEGTATSLLGAKAVYRTSEEPDAIRGHDHSAWLRLPAQEAQGTAQARG